MKMKHFLRTTAITTATLFTVAACSEQPANDDTMAYDEPAAVFSVATCNQPAAVTAASGDGLPEISVEKFKSHVVCLADDALGGRDTGSEGYQMAADYVAAHFKEFGLKPGGDNGSYFQTVNFENMGVDKEASMVSMTTGGDVRDLGIGEDILIGGTDEASELMAEAELVYVGMGTEEDLEGLDTEGKILVRQWSRGTKPRGGAVGVLQVFNDELAGVVGTWDRLKGFVGGRNLRWVTPDGKGKPSENDREPIPGGFISPDVAEKIFGGSYKDAEKGALDASMSMKVVTSASEKISSPNVAGILEGSDPDLKHEYVIITAHLDHVGDACPNRNNAGVEGDTICNGAMDNASGTSTMIEAARAFVAKGEAPRRSIMFLSVTAEEKGLMGAEYFAYNPTVSKENIVANVNLDMPVLLYDFADVVAFGGEHSSMGPIAARATEAAGISLAEDPMPEERLFTRSDHYRFVQQGIPAVFLMTGPTAVGDDMSLEPKERTGYKQFYGFLQSNYHSPADQIDQPIVWEAGAKFALVNYLIINEVANNDEKPTWNADSPFNPANSD